MRKEMAEELREFSSGWADRFPAMRIPDLLFVQVLSKSPSDADLVCEALGNDTKMLNDQKQKLTEQLSQINYCLNWIRKLDAVFVNVSPGRDNCATRRNELSVGRQSSLRTPPSNLRLTTRRGSDPNPLTIGNQRFRSPYGSARPVDLRARRGSDYENWTPPKSPSSPIYDLVPPPKPKVIHSDEFQGLLTKVCEEIPPNKGQDILRSLGETVNNDPIDLPKMLLRSKMIDESNLEPLLKALQDNGLDYLICSFEKFLKRKSPHEEENDYVYMKVDTDHVSTASEPPPVPSSPRPDRPESFTKTLFRVCNSLTVDQALSILHNLGEKNMKKSDLASEGRIVAFLLMNDHVNIANIDRFVEALEKENLHSLGEDLKKSLMKLETKFPMKYATSPRRGSLDSGRKANTSLARGSPVRGPSPLRGRSQTTSMERQVKPAKLLSLIHKSSLTRSMSYEGPLSQNANSQYNQFDERGASSDSEERDSKHYSSVISPISPKTNVFQFVIKVIEDYKPPDNGKRKSADYKKFVLIKGQQFDVIGTCSNEYIARNKKGEIGLVSKDKCEVVVGKNPVIWEKEWFLDCPVRHSTMELLQDTPTGTFFVRECNSKPGDLVLSVRLLTSFAKFSITINKACYQLMNQSFPSLDKLVAFYNENCIATCEGKDIFLTKPLQHKNCK